jgi:DNA polymerase (family 10)
VKNAEIAKVFQDIANLLELKDENPFKIRAYQRAARSIDHLPKEIAAMVQEGEDLQTIPGVGDAIAKKAVELVNTGKLRAYEELVAELPQGITALLEVPGVGPKTAKKLSAELGITSVEQLEEAIREGRVGELFGLGTKTADNILKQIQTLRRKDQRTPIGEALPVVEEMLQRLSALPGVKNLTAAGSLRRFRETVGDIDLMGTSDHPERVISAMVALPQVSEVLAQGPTKASVILKSGLQADLRMVEHDSFGSLLQYFTGSKQHNIALRTRAQKQKLKLSEYGITDTRTDKVVKYADEHAFYRRLGLQYIPPELREDRGEIALAEEDKLPKLIDVSDIKGDLHTHSDWSDGNDSIEAMARAAQARGYAYLAVTDHSAGRGIAHGLDAARLREQIALISSLNRRLKGIRLLSGTEVDIRADGRIDLPEDILADLDIVVASIHSAMTQDAEKITKRIIGAIENPHVDVIGHPTCRLLGERPPVAIDMEAVFRAAAKHNKALEINAMPSRLDLNDSHAFRARELGVPLVISTDAHSIAHLPFMRFGVGVARRGWCEPRNILNTKPLKEIVSFVKSHG